MNAGFFECVLSVFQHRVPSSIEYEADNKNPHQQLALSIIDILKRPLQLINRVSDYQNDDNLLDISKSVDIILQQFVKQILSRPLHQSTYYFLLPALGSTEDFPLESFIEKCKPSDQVQGLDLTKTVYHLGSLVCLTKSHIRKFDVFISKLI